jgi:hypothetical protein
MSSLILQGTAGIVTLPRGTTRLAIPNVLFNNNCTVVGNTFKLLDAGQYLLDIALQLTAFGSDLAYTLELFNETDSVVVASNASGVSPVSAPVQQQFQFGFTADPTKFYSVRFNAPIGANPNVAQIVNNAAAQIVITSLTSSGGTPGSGGGLGFYGNGADGALVFDGIATVLGMVPVLNVYTMVRDIYPATMTVNAGVTIIESDFRIVCQGTLTMVATSIINRNGNSAVGTVPGATLTLGSFGTPGQVGGTTPGGGGNSQTDALGGSGGDGGAGADGAGGAGGSVTVPPASSGGIQAFNSLPTAATGIAAGNSFANCGGGAGGGAGNGDGGNAAGAGGGGAGAVVILAKLIAGTGTIQAKGGAGANSAAAGNPGGGGGGGGGFISVVTSAPVPGTITLDASGGAGGTAHGTGVAGSVGAAGRVFQLIN